MLRRQVLDARERSIERTGVPVSALSGAELLASCLLDRAGRAALEASARQYHLSGRGVTRLLRVARTIADLEGVRHVNVDHVAEALGFRTVERV
jgi:magnesium chelatase family protein